MANEQAVSTPPENESYDAGMFADVRAAIDEVSKAPESAAEPVTEKPDEPAVKDAPVEAKADHPDDPKRYADGTFKPTKAETEKAAEPAAKVAPQKVEQEADKTAEGLAKAVQVDQQQPAPQGNPPPGWSVKSKAEWDKLPEHIRADIVKREKEVNDGFAQYSGMKELVPYVERARSQGQSLKQVLDSFIGIEDFIRRSPLQGILHIANGVGMTPQKLAMELAPYLGQSNGQYAQQPGYQPSGLDGGYQQPQIDPSMIQQWINPLLQPVMQEVNGIKTLFQQQQEAAVNTVLQRFVSDPAHRYYNNVEQQMAQLFAGGVVPRTGDHWNDLKNCYEAACRMDPEISELLINEKIAKTEDSRRQQEKEAAEKARLASRSITGSPAAGAKVDPDDKDDSIEADVRRAFRAHAA